MRRWLHSDSDVRNIDCSVGYKNRKHQGGFQEIVETKKYMPTLSEFKDVIKEIEDEIHNPWLDAFGQLSPFPQFENSAVSKYVYQKQTAELKKLDAAKHKMIGV